MDVYKFRAWDTESKRMIKDMNLTLLLLLFNENYEHGYTKDMVENQIIWMQCTGLNDKNGDLIYEGDIVQRKVRRTDYYPEQFMPHVPECKETKTWVETQVGRITMSPEVRFNNEFICGKLWKSSELGEYLVVSGWDYEIIDNIYEVMG